MEKLCERHLDRALGGPTVPLRVIGRGCDGVSRVGRVLHPQRLKQFLAKNRIPVGSACSLRDNAAGQKMSDVGIGEGRSEA
jgi:hypothetical protein